MLWAKKKHLSDDFFVLIHIQTKKDKNQSFAVLYKFYLLPAV